MYMTTYHIVPYNDWSSKELTFLFVYARFPGTLGKLCLTPERSPNSMLDESVPVTN